MNPVVLITGASRGIGRAEVYEFASKEYDIVLAYDTGDEAASQIAPYMKQKNNVTVLPVHADLSREEDIRNLVKEAMDQFGRIDVLINNAAVIPCSDFQEKKLQDWDAVMKVNLYAPFLLTQLIAPGMAQRKFGRIINTASMGATLTYSAQTAEYDASKAALINLTKTSALQYKPYVNVNCICPGAIDTDIYATVSPEQRELTQAMIPNGRFGRPEEIANVALFLASDLSSYVTGAVIPVDAAMSSGNFVEVPWEEPEARD